MTKYVLLLSTVLFFIACGNDNAAIKKDALLGEWKLIEIRENGILNKIECKDAILLHFKRDGIFDVEHFSLNISNNCISMGKIDEGTWKNNGNNTYNIDGDAVTPIFEGDKLIMVSTDGDETVSNGVFERQ